MMCAMIPFVESFFLSEALLVTRVPLHASILLSWGVLSSSCPHTGNREQSSLTIQSKNSFDNKRGKITWLVVGRARMHYRLFVTVACAPKLINFLTQLIYPLSSCLRRI